MIFMATGMQLLTHRGVKGQGQSRVSGEDIVAGEPEGWQFVSQYCQLGGGPGNVYMECFKPFGPLFG